MGTSLNRLAMEAATCCIRPHSALPTNRECPSHGSQGPNASESSSLACALAAGDSS